MSFPPRLPRRPLRSRLQPPLCAHPLLQYPPQSAPQGVETLQDYYAKNRRGAQAYSVTQFGLCLARDRGEAGWELRPFNFWLYPRKFRSNEPTFTAQVPLAGASRSQCLTLSGLLARVPGCQSLRLQQVGARGRRLPALRRGGAPAT